MFSNTNIVFGVTLACLLVVATQAQNNPPVVFNVSTPLCSDPANPCDFLNGAIWEGGVVPGKNDTALFQVDPDNTQLYYLTHTKRSVPTYSIYELKFITTNANIVLTLNASSLYVAFRFVTYGVNITLLNDAWVESNMMVLGGPTNRIELQDTSSIEASTFATGIINHEAISYLADSPVLVLLDQSTIQVDTWGEVEHLVLRDESAFISETSSMYWIDARVYDDVNVAYDFLSLRGDNYFDSALPCVIDNLEVFANTTALFLGGLDSVDIVFDNNTALLVHDYINVEGSIQSSDPNAILQLTLRNAEGVIGNTPQNNQVVSVALNILDNSVVTFGNYSNGAGVSGIADLTAAQVVVRNSTVNVCATLGDFDLGEFSVANIYYAQFTTADLVVLFGRMILHDGGVLQLTATRDGETSVVFSDCQLGVATITLSESHMFCTTRKAGNFEHLLAINMNDAYFYKSNYTIVQLLSVTVRSEIVTPDLHVSQNLYVNDALLVDGNLNVLNQTNLAVLGGFDNVNVALVNITGSLTIGSNAVLQHTIDLSNGQKYMLFYAAGGIEGTFSSVSTSSPVPTGYDVHFEYSTNMITVQATKSADNHTDKPKKGLRPYQVFFIVLACLAGVGGVVGGIFYYRRHKAGGRGGYTSL